jgi:hypothetical protein
MRRARKVEGELSRRLNEAYARWHNKNHSELPHAVGDREQQRRLLGTRERERNDHREVSRGVERRTSENPPSTRFGGLLDDGRIAESQLDELRNMRVLLLRRGEAARPQPGLPPPGEVGGRDAAGARRGGPPDMGTAKRGARVKETARGIGRTGAP